MSRRGQSGNPFTLFAFQDIITSVTGILILITLILALAMVVEPATSDASTDQSIEALKANLAQLESDIEDLETQTEVDQILLDLLMEFEVGSLDQLSTLLAKATKEVNDKVAKLENKKAKDVSDSEVIAREIDKRQQKLEQVKAENQKQAELLQKIKNSDRVVYDFQGPAGQEPWLMDLGESQWMCARVNKSEPPVVFDNPDLADRLSQFENWHHGITLKSDYIVLFVRPDGIASYQLIRSSKRLNRVEYGVEPVNGSVVIIDPKTGAVVR